MADPKSSEDDLVLHLSQSLKVTQALVETLLGEIKNNAGLRQEIENVKTWLASVARSIRGDGNGDQGLLHRATVMEQDVKAIRGWIDEQKDKEKDGRAGWWQVYAALVAGVLGLIAALIALWK